MMTRMIASALLVVVALGSSLAVAELPASRIVEYRFRETPTDPESSVVLDAYLDLKPVDSNGSEIVWYIATAWIESIDSSGVVQASWTLEGPDLASADGLWHTTHEDTADLLPSEFNDLPILSGIAESMDIGQGDLAFAFSSLPPEGGGGMYEGNVGMVTHSFLSLSGPIGAVEVDEDGKDEPVEIPRGEDPPNG